MTVDGALAPLALIAADSQLDHAIWYAARAFGLGAFCLATASVMLGLGITTRVGDQVGGRGPVADIHRALTLMTVLVVAGHVILVFLDQFTQFNILEITIPFVSSYRPLWTGLGVIAAYTIGTIFVSFYVRGRLGYRTWRYLHYATFAVFVAVLFHGMSVGTDAGAGWAQLLYRSATVAVAGVSAYRLVRGTGPRAMWVWEENASGLPMLRGVLAGCCGAVIVLALLIWPPSFTTHEAPIAGQLVPVHLGGGAAQAIPMLAL